MQGINFISSFSKSSDVNMVGRRVELVVAIQFSNVVTGNVQFDYTLE